MASVEEHRAVQSIAKQALAVLARDIGPDDTERTIAAGAIRLLADAGVDQTWYYDCPALVLLGSRSRLSISGRSYVPSDEPVGRENLVSVDLSPLRNGAWGDCARTFFVENGICVDVPRVPQFSQGRAMQRSLHQEMRRFTTAATTFEELFLITNELIQANGFENLDAQGNLGHSIEVNLDDRLFIERGNTKRLGDVRLFTFEPHIARVGDRWGFKHEDVYYFGSNGRTEIL